LTTLNAGTHPVYGVALNADGRLLAAGSFDLLGLLGFPGRTVADGSRTVRMDDGHPMLDLAGAAAAYTSPFFEL
jgi:hypothetical protein